MRKSTRMMLISNRGSSNGRNGGEMNGGQMYGNQMYGGAEYRGGSGGRNDYGGMENEMRGGMYGEMRRGRTRSEMGGGMRQGMGGGMEGGESRFRDRQGRTRYNNGRYAPRNEMEEDEWDIKGGYPPPIWENEPQQLMAGFSGKKGFRMDVMPVDEMERHGGHKMSGNGSGVEFTPEMAKEWTKNMENEDGTKGPHWPFEQAKQVMTRRGIVCDPYVFWAILNALYSDYCAVAKKHGITGVDFYADLAAAWLNDKDAKGNKAALYYECIVK